MKTEDMLIGIVNCLRLHVLSEPRIDSEVICKIRYATEVEVDMENSTDKFYKICTAIGAEGFCPKESITIK